MEKIDERIAEEASEHRMAVLEEELQRILPVLIDGYEPEFDRLRSERPFIRDEVVARGRVLYERRS